MNDTELLDKFKSGNRTVFNNIILKYQYNSKNVKIVKGLDTDDEQ